MSSLCHPQLSCLSCCLKKRRHAVVKALLLGRKQRLRSEGVELFDDWLIRAGRWSKKENHRTKPGASFRSLKNKRGQNWERSGIWLIWFRCNNHVTNPWNNSISFQAIASKSHWFNIQKPPNSAFSFFALPRKVAETCGNRLGGPSPCIWSHTPRGSEGPDGPHKNGGFPMEVLTFSLVVTGTCEKFSPSRLGYVGIMIQSDELTHSIIFQRGRANHHQPALWMRTGPGFEETSSWLDSQRIAIPF